MQSCSNENDHNNQLYNETEGTTVYAELTISSGGDNGVFWGTCLKLPVGKITAGNHLVILRTYDDFWSEFTKYLEKISKPFPILLERLPYLKCHMHGNWEEHILAQHLDPSYKIYICDHAH